MRPQSAPCLDRRRGAGRVALPCRPARAGHEFPFYASYYPQEITLSVSRPGRRRPEVRRRVASRLPRRDPFTPAARLRPPWRAAESLAAYVLVTLNPAARLLRRRRRADAAPPAPWPKLWGRPAYRPASLSRDALPSRLSPARRSRHGRERVPRRLGRRRPCASAPARPGRGRSSRRACGQRRRLGCRGRDARGRRAVDGGRRRPERRRRPAWAQDGLAARLPNPP